MPEGTNSALAQAAVRPSFPRGLRVGLLLGASVIAASLLAALLFPKGPVLAAFGDTLQVTLCAAVTVLAFQNILRSSARARIFWLLIFSGTLLWTASNGIWALYEIFFSRPVPDVPLVDILLFLKIVPLTAAIVVAPDQHEDSSLRAFGLLDVLILMLYSLYLFAFGVFAYRLLPGELETYNFHFNVAEAVGNLLLIIAAGIAVARSQGPWRVLYRFYFFAAACYGLGSNVSNVAIDTGHYYTGSLYDIPLIAALAAFVCMALAGRTMDLHEAVENVSGHSAAPSRHTTFTSSHLAMLVALSTPLVGIWLLSSASAPLALRPFRLGITLLTIFLLTLLLSIKQDLLTAGLFGSLVSLSETYHRIDRFKTHLSQGDKLTALGELVAQVANHIRGCMASILEASSRLTSRPDTESRIQNLAGKIGQYALRTDVLVENMLHFAQETPLSLMPLEVKPLIERALHLSRTAKLPNVTVRLSQEGKCPLVRGDSGRLMHVFLQLISNAVDALEETDGGTFEVTIRPFGSQLLLEFADSGPGLREPQRVFEPFYTTKGVGKGTGLGLSTCYGIIQQHAGEISCRNRPGGGAIFSILLPTEMESLCVGTEENSTALAEGIQ
jgi:signal transduction histidine kinase